MSICDALLKTLHSRISPIHYVSIETDVPEEYKVLITPSLIGNGTFLRLHLLDKFCVYAPLLDSWVFIGPRGARVEQLPRGLCPTYTHTRTVSKKASLLNVASESDVVRAKIAEYGFSGVLEVPVELIIRWLGLHSIHDHFFRALIMHLDLADKESTRKFFSHHVMDTLRAHPDLEEFHNHVKALRTHDPVLAVSFILSFGHIQTHAIDIDPKLLIIELAKPPKTTCKKLCRDIAAYVSASASTPQQNMDADFLGAEIEKDRYDKLEKDLDTLVAEKVKGVDEILTFIRTSTFFSNSLQTVSGIYGIYEAMDRAKMSKGLRQVVHEYLFALRLARSQMERFYFSLQDHFTIPQVRAMSYVPPELYALENFTDGMSNSFHNTIGIRYLIWSSEEYYQNAAALLERNRVEFANTFNTTIESNEDIPEEVKQRAAEYNSQWPENILEKTLLITGDEIRARLERLNSSVSRFFTIPELNKTLSKMEEVIPELKGSRLREAIDIVVARDAWRFTEAYRILNDPDTIKEIFANEDAKNFLGQPSDIPATVHDFSKNLIRTNVASSSTRSD